MTVSAPELLTEAHDVSAFNCGKAQPAQVAPVSHGTPAAVFSGVNILNTQQEGAR
jgi:TldD protein